MSVFFIHPNITVGRHVEAEAFYHASREELEQYVDVTPVRTEVVAMLTRPTAEDAVILFNKPDKTYSEGLLPLLKEAADAGAEVFPVAIDATMRTPPAVISHRQSFDLVDQLQRRDLSSAGLATVAVTFARTVLSRMQPTFSRGPMRLFLSYRRADGETAAAAFDKELRARVESPFRDLSDVFVGDDAEEVIDTNLRLSDSVVFVDTPKAGESEWVARELTTALALNLPVVWVRVGASGGRAPLRVEPADTPHFVLGDIGPAVESVCGQLVDDVVRAAFRISRAAATRVLGQFQRIKEVAETSGAQVTQLDRKHLVYSIRVPRRGFRYPERPITHLVQFYGRWPGSDDQAHFEAKACDLGFAPHPIHGAHYDAALLLAPIPPQVFSGSKEPAAPLVDSADEYANSLEAYLRRRGASPRRRGLIISGAFPDCEAEHQQDLTDCVHAFVRAVLDRGGTVIFGAHPTFQPLVFDMAARRRPDDIQDAVHFYVSRYFVSDADIQEFRRHSTVTATDAVPGHRASSLTLMRKAMIGDECAVGLVAMGGRTSAGGHAPGVDEEVDLARAAGMQVFLVGSTGGRAAQLAAELSAMKWKERLNKLTAQENEELLRSLDYGLLADRVMTSLGF